MDDCISIIFSSVLDYVSDYPVNLEKPLVVISLISKKWRVFCLQKRGLTIRNVEHLNRDSDILRKYRIKLKLGSVKLGKNWVSQIDNGIRDNILSVDLRQCIEYDLDNIDQIKNLKILKISHDKVDLSKCLAQINKDTTLYIKISNQRLNEYLRNIIKLYRPKIEIVGDVFVADDYIGIEDSIVSMKGYSSITLTLPNLEKIHMVPFLLPWAIHHLPKLRKITYHGINQIIDHPNLNKCNHIRKNYKKIDFVVFWPGMDLVLYANIRKYYLGWHTRHSFVITPENIDIILSLEKKYGLYKTDRQTICISKTSFEYYSEVICTGHGIEDYFNICIHN